MISEERETIVRKSPAIQLRDEIAEANREAAIPTGEHGLFTTDRQRAILNSIQAKGGFLTEFPIRRAFALKRGMEMLAKSDKKRHFALTDLLGEYDLRGINALFDSHVGSLVLPGNIDVSRSVVADFYTQQHRYQDGDIVELRGESYFVNLDKTKNAEQKMAVVGDDIAQAMEAIEGIDRDDLRTTADYLGYLGVLDYLKMHTLTLFHAVTYGERYGSFPEPGTMNEKQYKLQRQRAVGLMNGFVRRYYQTMLGFDYDGDLNFDQTGRDIASLMGYVKNQMFAASKHSELAGRSFFRFNKYPEVNHPLVIALGAQEAARVYADVDDIVGIPTGGTETSIVTRLLHEAIDGSNPKLIFLLYTIHSEVTNPMGVDELVKIIKQHYLQDILGKKILLVDDNASSGATLETLGRGLLLSGASKVYCHTAEFDGRRLVTESEGPVFDPDTSRTTMGIAQIGRDNQHQYKKDVQRRLTTEKN